jgi:hypothetical protein
MKSKFAALVMMAAAAIVMDENAQGTGEVNTNLWKPRVTSVAVFKNGLGFFVREGEVELRDGWCVAGEIPPAHFGTLAIFSSGTDGIVDIVGSGPGELVEFDGTDASEELSAKRDRLKANRWLKVQLTYTYREAERTSAGTLVSIGSEFAVLESADASFAVPLEAIRKLQVLEQPVRIHVAGAGEKPPAKTKLDMAYLRKGITWIPEYSLKLLGEESAELTLRGTLVNEAEDLVHCDVNFVVGVPHFLHTDFLAPVAAGQIIRTIGTAVAPREVMSQIMNSAAIAGNLRSSNTSELGVVDRRGLGGSDLSEVLGNLPPMEGPGGADFTVYAKKGLTVRRGEKAIITLFVKRIQYSHIYRWSPPEPLQHYIVLHNQTDTAWTTGPCLAVNQNSPLSEDLLKYVPKNGSGEIPVTAAINVVQERKESEVDRKLKAHEPSHQFWLDLVTLRGELKIRNLEKTPITIVVDAPVEGKPLTASDDGTIRVDSAKLQLLERSGSIRWEVQIDPGATRTLTYEYERYVPSR